jgi:membrane fusion protein, multidrug efflux system
MTVRSHRDAVADQAPWQPGISKKAVRLSGYGKWLATAGLAALLGGYWYYNHTSEGSQRRPRAATAPVHVATVSQRDMAVVERTIGTVIAYDTVQVTPMVAGRIESAFFKEGRMVKKGDLLFRIDARPFEAALDQAKGQLAKDQAALDGARRDLTRFQALLKENAESQQVVDDQKATVDSNAGIVEADKASLQTAALNVEYTQIRSPVDGQTGPITVMPGNIISVTGTTTNVNPLVTINQVQPTKISFFLPQSDLLRIQAQQKAGQLFATIDQRDVGGSTFTVPVDFVSNIVNNATGTIELRATYANADMSLVPGQLVNVVVGLNRIPNATVVPHDALAAGPDSQYVYRVADGRAEEIPVSVLFDDSQDAAVQGNLKPGDQVVTEGQLQVVPGGAVEIVQGAQVGPNQGRDQTRKGAHKARAVTG